MLPLEPVVEFDVDVLPPGLFVPVTLIVVLVWVFDPVASD
jgi:hypothetical protein